MYASPVLFEEQYLRFSATGATLDTGGWLTLSRQGLSPYKMRQASWRDNALHKRLGGFFAKSDLMQMLGALAHFEIKPFPSTKSAGARPLSKSPESTDSARAAHSLDNPATLPVESGLPVRFWSQR